MYEMAKLKDQFKDILAENGLLPRQNDENSDPSCRDVRNFPLFPVPYQ